MTESKTFIKVFSDLLCGELSKKLDCEGQSDLAQLEKPAAVRSCVGTLMIRKVPRVSEAFQRIFSTEQ